jgi:hypothetical protein
MGTPMNEDTRLTAAREFLIGAEADQHGSEPIIRDLIAYAEERLRVNVGLVADNSKLRRQVQDISEGRETDAPDVEDVRRLLGEALGLLNVMRR